MISADNVLLNGVDFYPTQHHRHWPSEQVHTLATRARIFGFIILISVSLSVFLRSANIAIYHKLYIRILKINLMLFAGDLTIASSLCISRSKTFDRSIFPTLIARDYQAH